jgi:hypothetical protein
MLRTKEKGKGQADIISAMYVCLSFSLSNKKKLALSTDHKRVFLNFKELSASRFLTYSVVKRSMPCSLQISLQNCKED